MEHEINDAERKAWDALARYKFWMFGYWAAIWVASKSNFGTEPTQPV